MRSGAWRWRGSRGAPRALGSITNKENLVGSRKGCRGHKFGLQLCEVELDGLAGDLLDKAERSIPEPQTTPPRRAQVQGSTSSTETLEVATGMVRCEKQGSAV